MSIVKAINELSGKEAVTIEDAIRNVDISGGGDKGYECTESIQTLTEESITTQQGQAQYASVGLSYNTLIDADVLKVTFNGTEYTCAKHDIGSVNAYGGLSSSGPNFSEYPFAVFSSPNGSVAMNGFFTETEGTYSIKIEAIETIATTTPCFEKAVQSVTAPLMINFMEADAETGYIYFDKTFGEVTDAYLKGRPCILNYKFEGADNPGLFSAASILNAGKDPARVIFPRGIESIALYAKDVDSGRLYTTEKGIK